MIRSNLRDYVSDLCNVYILVSGSITIDGEGDDDATKLLDKRNEGVIFKKCISNICNTQINNATDIDVVMPMHSLIEYSNNYSKTGSLWQFYRDDSNDNITI